MVSEPVHLESRRKEFCRAGDARGGQDNKYPQPKTRVLVPVCYQGLEEPRDIVEYV